MWCFWADFGPNRSHVKLNLFNNQYSFILKKISNMSYLNLVKKKSYVGREENKSYLIK